MISGLRSIDYRLWAAIFLTALLPTLYATTRIYFLNSLPDTGSLNIAAQSAWLHLAYEVLQEALLLPLYFVFGQVLGDLPALQRGPGNDAHLTMVGQGGAVGLLQENSLGLPFGNRALIRAEGLVLGVVRQSGAGNHAALDLRGALGAPAEGEIRQLGNGLTARLEIEPGGWGSLSQEGAENAAFLAVEAGARASLVQIGEGLSSGSPAALRVFSTSPGEISITQSSD